MASSTEREWSSVESILDAKWPIFPNFSRLRSTEREYEGRVWKHSAQNCRVWGDVRAIESLISAGADINERNEDGMTALHHAVAQDHPEAVRRLVELGASLDIRDNAGNTVRALATGLRNRSVIAYLAKHGA